MASKKHSFSRTEIMAGLMVIASVAVAIGFIAAIRGMRPAEDLNTFHATFPDTGGLNPGADVRFGGFKVGRVTDIAPHRANQSLIQVDFAVRADTPVNQESVVTIAQTTLMADKHLEISTGAPDAPRIEPDSLLPSQAGGLFDQVGQVADSVTRTLDDVIALLGVETVSEKTGPDGKEKELVTVAELFGGVGETIDEGKAIVHDLRDVVNDARGDLEAILKKIQEVGDGAKEIAEQINGILAENREPLRGSVENVEDITYRVSGLVDGLGDDIKQIADSLQAVLDNADTLSGDARDLLATNRAPIEDIILDLRETVRNLKAFARTMAEQPEAVLRGKSPHGRR